MLKERRISEMNLEEVYFWTDTVKDWKSLLSQDKYKKIIIDLMKEKVEKGFSKKAGRLSVGICIVLFGRR